MTNKNKETKKLLSTLQEKIEDVVEELYIGDITDDGRKELKEEISKIFKEMGE